jgi:hypothetical protein
VVPEDPNIELTKLARSLTLSTNVYSDAMAHIAKQTLDWEVIARSVTQQLEIERRLFASTDAILNRITQFETISPSIQSIVATNASFARIVERIFDDNKVFSKIFEEQKRIQNMIGGIGLSDLISSAFGRIDTTRMLSASLAAQAKLSALDNLTLGRLAGIDQAFSRAISTNLGNLTRSYQSLIDVAATRESLANQLPLITTYAPVEYCREIDVLKAITIDDESNDEDDKLIANALIDSLPSVDSLLEAFDVRLSRLLHGARQALIDDNPDRARHVTTSVRELFTQVLHALAPDNDIRQWSSSPELFHDNRPTRRARLLFICREINCDPLSRFVEDDVRAALSFVESLSYGTHVVESKLTHSQLSSIVSRVESLLVFLLQLRNGRRT